MESEVKREAYQNELQIQMKDYIYELLAKQ